MTKILLYPIMILPLLVTPCATSQTVMHLHLGDEVIDYSIEEVLKITFEPDSMGAFDLDKLRIAVNSFSLKGNRPNPFNPSTTINYDLSQGGVVDLRIFDISGREVAVLVNERQIAGKHHVSWSGLGLPSGSYFYRLRFNNAVQAQRMVLVN